MGECINLKLSQSQVDNITKKQFDIVKRMIEKKTSAEKLKSFIEKINKDGKWNELLNLSKEEFDRLEGDALIAKLTGKKFPITSVRVKKFCATTEFDSSNMRSTGFVPPFTLEEGLSRTLEFEFVHPKEDDVVYKSE